MNEREIAEIRRRMRPEKNNIGRIRCCYVNDNHNIISNFDQILGLISSNEAEEILSLLRKTLSGTIGRNLINIEFSNQQVLDSEEHKLLSTLRDSSLSNEEAVSKLFEKIIASLEIEGSYFIILAKDTYDIFKYDENGEKSESTETFSYILCAVCPIKNAKPKLGYNISEKKFKNIINDSVITSPELGFMFPAYENHSANIYSALFYTHDTSVSYENVVGELFKSTLPMPAEEQTESIASILNGTVAENCDLELVKSVQSQLIEIAEDHKVNKEENPLLLSVKDVEGVLRCSGVKEDIVESFSEKLKADLGENTTLPPANILNIKKLEVRTPDVTVKVNPEVSDLVETRIIDGTKYILIRADGDVEVNGIKINITK